MIRIEHIRLTDPPQVSPPNSLREKGQRRGQLSTAHKTERPRSWINRWRVRLALLAIPLGVGLSACSAEEDHPAHRASPDHFGLNRAGEQVFECNDSSMVSVEVLPGGLSLNLKEPRSGPAKRLTAVADGLPYVGEAVSLAHSHNTIAIMHAGKPVKVCRRAPNAKSNASQPAASGPRTTEPDVRESK